MRPALAVSLLAPLLLCSLAAPALATPKVVTDFAPIQSLVEMVMGDTGTPTVLLPVGGDPHDFQMRPSQASVIANADVIFWDGPELMPALDRAITSLGAADKAVSLLHDGGGKTRAFDDGEGTDPHAWLDPDNARAWLATIATRLGALDPANAATYAGNATRAEHSIAALDAELKAKLAPARGVPLVEFHDAFGYFAAHFGLTLAGAIELGDAASPSAARLSEIRAELRKAKATCVFPEAGRDPRLIASVTEGSGARIGRGQDPEATSLTDKPGPELYPTLMRNLAATVADCVAQ